MDRQLPIGALKAMERKTVKLETHSSRSVERVERGHFKSPENKCRRKVKIIIKYVKPGLIDMQNEMNLTVSKGACSSGTTNIEQCGVGGHVIPGCRSGFAPSVKCAKGSSV